MNLVCCCEDRKTLNKKQSHKQIVIQLDKSLIKIKDLKYIRSSHQSNKKVINLVSNQKFHKYQKVKGQNNFINQVSFQTYDGNQKTRIERNHKIIQSRNQEIQNQSKNRKIKQRISTYCVQISKLINAKPKTIEFCMGNQNKIETKQNNKNNNNNNNNRLSQQIISQSKSTKIKLNCSNYSLIKLNGKQSKSKSKYLQYTQNGKILNCEFKNQQQISQRKRLSLYLPRKNQISHIENDMTGKNIPQYSGCSSVLNNSSTVCQSKASKNISLISLKQNLIEQRDRVSRKPGHIISKSIIFNEDNSGKQGLFKADQNNQNDVFNQIHCLKKEYSQLNYQQMNLQNLLREQKEQFQRQYKYLTTKKHNFTERQAVRLKQIQQLKMMLLHYKCQND